MTREYNSLPDRQNPSIAKDIHGSKARPVNISDGSTTFRLVNTLDDSYESCNSWYITRSARLTIALFFIVVQWLTF